MTTPAGEPTEVADARRVKMLQAAVEVIEERGFSETRITDVAERAQASPALVIYYFATKDNLLAEALRYAEELWYEAGSRQMAGIADARGRLEAIVRMSCIPEGTGPMDSWVLWLDLWAQAVRDDEVAAVREQFDRRWRETICQIVRAGQDHDEFSALDPEEFAMTFCALLDGLAVQIALRDPVVTPERAFELSMAYAGDRLGFAWASPDARRRSRR